MDLYSWKYRVYGIKDNQIKDCKIFSPYTQFKIKGFEFQDTKKIYIYIYIYCVVIDDQNKNIVCNLNWKQCLFDFDARYRDQKFVFVFDQSTRTLFTSNIFIKVATIVSGEYLRHGKNFNINTFFTDCFVSKKRK